MSGDSNRNPLSPEVDETRNADPSKSKDNHPEYLPRWLTIEKQITNHQPYYWAITRVHNDGPSRRQASTRPSQHHGADQGSDRELVKLLLEDNQRLRDTLVELTKSFPTSSSNQGGHESFISRSLKEQDKVDGNPTIHTPKEKEGHRDNRKNPIRADN